MPFQGRNLLREDPRVLNDEVGGRAITFIPQDPWSSMSPLFPVGAQIMDLMKWKSPGGGGKARGRHRAAGRRCSAATLEHGGAPTGRPVIEILRAAQIPEPERALARLPHELSGGQRQRLVACYLAAD
jgi:peptide/nickel transport system ATP-binding protein